MSDIWVSDDATVAMATVAVDGHVRVHKNVVLDAELPWAFGSTGFAFVPGPFYSIAYSQGSATLGN